MTTAAALQIINSLNKVPLVARYVPDPAVAPEAPAL